MKAHWDTEDRFQIGLGHLDFAPEDIDLIYRVCVRGCQLLRHSPQPDRLRRSDEGHIVE
jgi:hypothetical protein